MIGTKLKLDNLKKLYYEPWDCTTTKHKKVEDWSKSTNKLKLILEYTKTSFFKSYPLLFDSSNLDPTKTWLMGCQIAAINIQSTKDDYTLINQVFFTLNNNSGYILKPKYMREGNLDIPLKPKLNLSIRFVSGVMLQTLSDNLIKEIKITVEVVGSHDDDKYNLPHNFIKITRNFINPIFKNEIVNFNIYLPEISFILIKIYDSSHLIGRCVIPIFSIMNGFRIIDIYDNDCNLVQGSCLSCIVNKKDI